ncbi:pdcd2 domain protein [Niveomyces insectorum RCEF 264]|uniref:Pdcd2 domain protein n=1 Tax=Niveomyces insectorum RCEF 264 TaxID=1081102 RepID=A0A162MQJ6_9HYPO|nr:pdcd2 domain protein [Niveomyces insectorum RCEF 264]
MPPYDSDSSEDDDDATTQLSYTETDVLLGYAQSDAGGETVSRLGGRPEWLVADQPPSAALARCRVCQSLLVLLLQLNGELPDRFPHHQRRLYVFACRNKACRRKAGSIRVLRGVRVEAGADAGTGTPSVAAEPKKQTAAPADTLPKPAGTAPGLGEALFGVKNPFSSAATAGGGGGNPFAATTSSTTKGSSAPHAQNPFSVGGASAAAAATTTPAANTLSSSSSASPAQPQPPSDAADDLPTTFAETLSLNTNKDAFALPTHRPAAPPEPWPPAESWPPAYPVSWIAEAEYETLDSTPAALPDQAVRMEVDDTAAATAGGGSGGGKEDKYVFESSMDAAFQKFADRVAQNPEQVIRYEFSGQPLFYNKDDAVAAVWGEGQHRAGGDPHASITTVLASHSANRLPPCPNCRARRVFEVQLMPHAIDLLEADELGLEGMDWGTVVVGVCERDCQAPGTAPGAASYLEEWAGVQWEELAAKR